MDIFGFAVSEGWLAKVKERRDSAGVDSTVLNNWKDDLQTIIEGYDKKTSIIVMKQAYTGRNLRNAHSS